MGLSSYASQAVVVHDVMEGHCHSVDTYIGVDNSGTCEQNNAIVGLTETYVRIYVCGPSLSVCSILLCVLLKNRTSLVHCTQF